MNDYTRPTGASLRGTHEVTDGDRIADALRCLKACPPPAWLRVGWMLSLRRSQAGDDALDPADSGRALSPHAPDEGIIPWGSVRATPPHETFGTGFAWSLSEGVALGEWCPCGVCTPSGMPAGLLAELTDELARQRDFDEYILKPPWPAMRSYLASDVVTLPRAIRAACRPMYEAGGVWEDKAARARNPTSARDGDGFEHLAVRMSDWGIAHGAACVGLTAGMLPIEVYAALAEGFSYPVPETGTPEWEAWRRHEAETGEPYIEHAARVVADAVAKGVPPYENAGAAQPHSEGEVAA